MYLLLGLVSCFLFPWSSLFLVPCPCLVSLVFFIDLCLLVFLVLSLWLSLPVYFNLCIVWSCVSYYIDILVLTPHFVSRRLLSCLLSLYHDLYLITWLRTCLFDYDFDLVQLNHYFHYIVHLGPHSLSLSCNGCVLWHTVDALFSFFLPPPKQIHVPSMLEPNLKLTFFFSCKNMKVVFIYDLFCRFSG